MPTGYTADVADGKVTDFRTFALRCARAFGATIMQRDDPMDEAPKLREESAYYATALAEAEARLAALDGMTLDAAEQEATAEYERGLAEHEERVAEDAEKRNRYKAMLAEVVAWTPPTSAHAKLKEFMVEQLTESLKFDCGMDWTAPTRLSGAEWLAKEWAEAAKSVNYRRAALAEERERVAGANAWITALYESLTPSTAGR